MPPKKILGMIDWGIGGIGIVKLIKEKQRDVPVIYFSDTGVTPYGKMNRDELAARLETVIDLMTKRGATHIVMGCNAASSIIPYLKEQSVPVKGVIEAGVACTARVRPERLGLIGGRQTILSGAYRRAFRRFGIKVHQRIAQPLSALIESGDISSGQLRTECKRILEPIKNSSHILLACTHYPAILPLLRESVSRQTFFIDPAPELVESLREWDLGTGNCDTYLTTGDAGKMKAAARAAFDWDIRNVTQVSI
jgi:glutamate racemase